MTLAPSEEPGEPSRSPSSPQMQLGGTGLLQRGLGTVTSQSRPQLLAVTSGPCPYKAAASTPRLPVRSYLALSDG